jgi:hypothetical protein
LLPWGLFSFISGHSLHMRYTPALPISLEGRVASGPAWLNYHLISVVLDLASSRDQMRPESPSLCIAALLHLPLSSGFPGAHGKCRSRAGNWAWGGMWHWVCPALMVVISASWKFIL